MAVSMLEMEFTKAVNTIKTWDPYTLPTDDEKLMIYSWFKQATEGNCQSKRPGMFDFVGRRKWDAWNAKKDVSKQEAMKSYIDTVTNLLATHGNRASE